MEGKANFSRRMKQFDGLTWLILTPHILRKIYATGLERIRAFWRCHLTIGAGISHYDMIRYDIAILLCCFRASK